MYFIFQFSNLNIIINFLISPLVSGLFFFLNWDSLYARLNSHYKAWSYKKKKGKKIKAYRKSLQKEPTANRCLLILDLKPFRLQVKGKHSIGREFQILAVQRKRLLIQTSLQHLGMVTEKSSIYQNKEQTSLEKKEPVEPGLKNTYQSNTYRKKLSWPHFDNESPRVQEKQQVKDQQSCIFFSSLSNNSKQQLGAPAQM